MTNRHVGPRLSVERLARELARTDRRLTTIETAPQLAHSSVDVDGVDYTVPDTVRVGKDAADKAENARQVVEQLDQELADARTALEEADAALQDMLADIDVDMEEHQSRIDELRNVTIPSLENDLASARQELEQADAQLDARLGAAQRDLADHEDQIANLRDVTIPGLADDLADHEGRLNNLRDVTLPALESDLAANADEVANLRDVTVPGIADDLASARQELEQADQGLDERLDVFGGRVDAAEEKANNAESNAQTAIEAAGAAQDAADGKPVMLFDTGAPSGTAPKGSTWFRVNDSGQVIGQWQQTEDGADGSQWEQREIRSEVIANLDVGKLTAGSAAISEAVIEKLWAEVIHARKITSDMLVVGNSSNLVDNPGLSGGSMDGWEVVSGSWSVVSSEVRNVLRTTIFNGGLIRNLRRFDCVPGDQYRFAVSIRGAGSGDKIARIRWYDSDGVDLDASTELSAHGHGWTDRSTTATAPAGAFSGQLEFEVTRTGNTNYEVMFATPEIRPMTGPALIVDGAITAEKVDAESVAAAVGSFVDLSAEQITSGTISTSRLNAQEVAGATGQFLELDAGQITSGKISTARLDAQDVAAHVGGFIELSTDQLVAGDAAIGEGVVDKLWADVIRARKITSDMLVIGGTRLIDNPIFEPDDSGTWGPGWLHPSEDPTARGTAEFYKPDDLDANAVRFMSDGENGFLINMPNTRRAAVTPGQEVRVAADVKVPDGPGVIFGINFRDRDGNTANNGAVVTVPSTGNVWQRFEASFVVPDDGSATMEFVIAAILATGSATVAISNVDMRPKTGPELIVDGAVAARHVNAESVAGAVGTFLDLSADQITSGTIDAGRLNAQEVAAHVGGFLEITTDQLVAGDATIGEAVIDKLWTDTFAARKVTAAEINVQSLAASSAFVSELTANSALVSNLEAQIVRADMFQGNEFTGGTFTGTTFRTGTSGQRVQIDASDGIRAWNGSGQQTLRLSGGDNLIAGQLYTNVPGDPGIILKPVTATGLPGVFFSENGTTDAEQPAIYTDESWRLTIRAKRSNGARGAVRMQGALYMSGSAVTGGLDGQPGTYRWSIDPNGHAEFRSMAIWSGAEWFQVNNGAVGSTMIYNRTGSAGANMTIGSAGWIGRSTSASKYKIDIQDAPVEWHERILALNPRTWIDRPNAERYAEYLTRKGEPGYDEDLALSMIDPVTQRVPGLIAEDVEDAGLSEYVTYGDDGQIEGLAYDRLWTLLIPLVRDLRDRVAALEGASRA